MSGLELAPFHSKLSGGYFLPYSELEFSANELYAEVARERLRGAVMNCELMKARMDVAVSAQLRGLSVSGMSHRSRMKLETAARKLASGSLNTRLEPRKLKLHPELAGLSRSEYTTQLSRQRRADLYARGLTCRGTPRILTTV